MSQHDPMVYLGDMYDYGREALDISKTIRRETLDNDRLVMLALTRLIEIVGEAANKVPTDVRKQHPSIKWGGIIGMRNRLIHAYNGINMDIVWEVLTEELPSMVDYLSKVVKD